MTKANTGNQGAIQSTRTFIVRSANEAAVRVREELGPRAKVISVRQVTGSGLQRFLSAPRLEVVACVEALPPAPAPAACIAGTDAVGTADSGVSVVKKRKASPERPVEELAGPLCREVLERAGLNSNLLGRLERYEEWRSIQSLSAAEGLPRAVGWLRAHRERRGRLEPPTRCAFVGGSGAGKTTAICKLLARDVFVHGASPRVLRLEVDKPHLDDGLALYCEVLGVQCFRSPEDVDLKDPAPLYIDVPGFSLNRQSEQARIVAKLDELEIADRVLVLNGAYDVSVLRNFCVAGERLGAAYRVLTHLDELDHWGKLWEFALDGDHPVWFLSFGQNVAGDQSDDVFGAIIDRTFPA